MDSKQKREIIKTINEAYPEMSDDDSILLVGSTALGFETKDSDIDIKILTKNMAYFRKISYEKGVLASTRRC